MLYENSHPPIFMNYIHHFSKIQATSTPCSCTEDTQTDKTAIMAALFELPPVLFQFSNFYSSFYRAMHFSAERGLAIACRLSVCL